MPNMAHIGKFIAQMPCFLRMVAGYLMLLMAVVAWALLTLARKERPKG